MLWDRGRDRSCMVPRFLLVIVHGRMQRRCAVTFIRGANATESNTSTDPDRPCLREFLRECAAADVEVTMYDAGEGLLYPTEQWTVHFFKWLRVRV